MKYFTKWLPVEGVIEKGDTTIKDGIRFYHHDISQSGLEEGHQKIKLFLCTRDIQVGDKVRTFQNPTAEWTLGEINQYMYISGAVYSLFKVIGEISKDAIWVKEDMEFEEGDINRQFYDDSGSSESEWLDYNRLHTEEDWLETPDNWKRIQIKCPTCQKFH